MLVAVNQPIINDFKIEGTLSSTFLNNLKKEFRDAMKIIHSDEDDGYVDFKETDWFKEVESSITPASNLAFYRKLVKMTQKELAEKLGTSKQVISDMEHGRKPISKKTAKELAKIFSVSVARFI